MQERARIEDASGPGLSRSGLAALVVLMLLFVAFCFRAAPLDLDAVRTQNAPDAFDAKGAITRLARILDGQPHGVDSAELDGTRARLLREIVDLGYAPEIHDEIACRTAPSGSAARCARVKNVVFASGPTTGPAVVLTAHYDSVDAGPGVGDDGIGVAVWLDVARLFKTYPPTKPVVFLLTDGEETGLLGAQAFVDHQAYGRQIARIINLEARGDRGPAMMFETSHPNAGLVADWARAAHRPVANSMMSAIYELLPNSTDLTVHLHQGYAGINLAIADGLASYHTPHDDFAHLDLRSVQHMGDQAWEAARAFVNAPNLTGSETAYADVASRFFVMLPQQATVLLLGLCFGGAALLTMSPARDLSWRTFSWRAFFLPLAVLAGSGLLAWATSAGIGLVRPEPAYWLANGQPLHGAIFVGALAAAAVGLAFCGRNLRREAVFASGWFWFLAIGMGASFAVPGMAMTFLIPGAAFVVCAGIGRWAGATAPAMRILAGLATLIVMLPLIHLVDVMMGLGVAPVFGVLEGLMLAPLLCLIGPVGAAYRVIFGPLGVGYAALAALAIAAPAYSADRPLAFDLAASYDMDARTAELAAAVDPAAVPSALRALLSAPPAPVIPGLSTPLRRRALMFTDRPAARADVVSTSATGATRVVVLRFAAPGARQVRLRIPSDAKPLAIDYEGSAHAMTMHAPQDGTIIFDCVGRRCDGSSVTVTLPSGPSSTDAWLVQGYWQGLPSDASDAAATRTAATVPIQSGDVTITTRRLRP